MDNKKSIGTMKTFSSPYLTFEHRQTTGFQIFYIYKRSNNKILIGKKITNDSKNDFDNIVGWGLVDALLNWDNGLALEANFDSDAVNERMGHNVKARVYSTERQARGLINDPYDTNLIYYWDNDSFGFRESGKRFRLPVINIHNNIITCLVIGVMGFKDNTNQKKVDFDVISPYISTYLEGFLSKAEINRMKLKQTLVSVKGYVPIKIDNFEYPLFKIIKIFERQELGKIVVSLQVLLEGAEVNGRKSVKSTLIELLQSQEEMKKYTLRNMTLNEANLQLFGLPLKDILSENHRIKDITDPSVFSDNDFRKYLDILKDSFEKLDEIYNSNNYPYLFRSNDTPYYWIEYDVMQQGEKDK